MREIKFRAWDKKTKTMREVESIAFHNKRSVFDFDDSRLPKVVNAWGRDCIEQKDIILHREKNQYVLMQYTGLKDKNGVEIYEGDIILQDRDLCAIVSCVGGFDCKMIGGPHVGSTFVFSYLHGPSCEVIGNIYENAELMPRTPETTEHPSEAAAEK